MMDADRKKYSFEYWYKPMYLNNSKLIACIFDFDNLIESSDGYMLTLRKDIVFENIDDNKIRNINDFIEKNSLLEEKFLPFRLSGDADYQILDENGNKAREMHMFPNFSLMPVTGNLNILKGTRSLKVFLEKNLKIYFENRDISNIPYRKWGPQYRDNKRNEEKEVLEKAALKAFFDIFASLDEYCENMYFLNMEKIHILDETLYWKQRVAIADKCNIPKDKMEEDIDSSEIR